MLDVRRRDKAHTLDVGPTFPLLALALGAIAIADVATAGWAAAFLCPAMLLATQGRARFRVSIERGDSDDPRVADASQAGVVLSIEVDGPLLFLSVPSIDRLFSSARGARYVVLDLNGVTTIDSSALFALRELLERVDEHGSCYVLVCTPRSPVFRALHSIDLAGRALGGTVCFTRNNALARIAERHPVPPPAAHDAASALPRLYLVRTPRD